MATPSKRRPDISRTTRDILFALSGNECAYPDCTERLVKEATEKSPAAKIGQIAHIYSHSPNGPRGQGGLNQKQLVALDNLLLLCSNHHALVDRQESEYSAETLKRWKSQHESGQMQRKLHSQQAMLQRPLAPPSLADKQIEQDVGMLRKSRFFADFNSTAYAQRLADAVLEGSLAGGSSGVRAKALAWCARILFGEAFAEAEQYLSCSKSLGSSDEVSIAEALVVARRQGIAPALHQLAELDTPPSKAAALALQVREQGPAEAIEWFDRAGITLADLDSDGKCALMNILCTVSDWNRVVRVATELSDDDYRDTPFLLLHAAMANLLKAVPDQLRNVVSQHPPFYASQFILADDPAAILCRRTAQLRFAEAKSAASELGCETTAQTAEVYELWLLLRDHDHADTAKQRLEKMLRDRQRGLGFVNLAVEFGLPIDRKRIHSEIDQCRALHGGHTADSAIASLSLALHDRSPEDFVSYIDDNLQALSELINVDALVGLLIEALVNSGRVEEARTRLGMADQMGLSESAAKMFREQLAAMQSTDTLHALKVRAKATGKLSDLAALVSELHKRNASAENLVYYKKLFQQTKAVEHLTWYATALDDTANYDELLEVLASRQVSLDDFPELQILYCWTLLRQGSMVEAIQYMQGIRKNFDDARYRALYVNLFVSLGDWNRLSQFVLNELSCEENRTGHELISASGLALHLRLPQAFDLASSAVKRSPDDPGVLSAAYLLAVQGGFDGKREVREWLGQAIDLSDDDGPLHRATIEDFIGQRSQWNRDARENWKRLKGGDIPICAASLALGQPFTDFTVAQAKLNLQEIDPRCRVAVPAYWGGRPPIAVNLKKPIGFDSTALLTLTQLGILEDVFGAITEVWIPHSTLRWLFAEERKINFHQPSRVRDAEKLRSFCAQEGVHEQREVTPDDRLLSEVGEEMGELLTAAHQRTIERGTPCFVVHSRLVYRVSSLMEEEADLGPYAEKLCGYRAVVDAIAEAGHVSVTKRRRAQVHFDAHEPPTPDPPTVSSGATLYLDGLAATYFLHLDLLSEIRRAGFEVVISRQKMAECTHLIERGALTEQVASVLSELRKYLSVRIADGRIAVGHALPEFGRSPMSVEEDPSMSVLSLAAQCEMIVSDDRFVNRRIGIESDGQAADICTTLDLLDALAANGKITQAQRLEHRSELRRRGYVFVPVEEEEVRTWLSSSAISDDRLIEAASLRDLRENVATAQMGDWLHLPEEHRYLAALWQSCGDVLRETWMSATDFGQARLYSDSLFELMDVRRWSSSIEADQSSSWQVAWPPQLCKLLVFTTRPSETARQAYETWLQEAILWSSGWPGSIKTAVLEDWKSMLRHAVRVNLDSFGSGKTNEEEIASFLVGTFVNHSTLSFVKDALLDDAEFLKEFRLSARTAISIDGENVRFDQTALFSAVRDVLGGIRERRVLEIAGSRWRVRRKTIDRGRQAIVLSRGKLTLRGTQFDILSSEKGARTAALRRMIADVRLPAKTFDDWLHLAEKGALDDDEASLLFADFRNTPAAFARRLRDEARGRGSDALVVPYSETYFSRLVGTFDGSESISDYASGGGGEFLRQLTEQDPYSGFLSGLLMASHPAISANLSVDGLSSERIIEALSFVQSRGDMISIVGAIEVGFRVVIEKPDIEPHLVALIREVADDDPLSEKSGCSLLSSLYIFSYGEMARLRLLDDKPLYYRRLAAFAHVALMQRELRNAPVNYTNLSQY